MTDVAKGLNLKGGTNTHRFQSKADRIALQSVNVTRKVRRREGGRRAEPHRRSSCACGGSAHLCGVDPSRESRSCPYPSPPMPTPNGTACAT